MWRRSRSRVTSTTCWRSSRSGPACRLRPITSKRARRDGSRCRRFGQGTDPTPPDGLVLKWPERSMCSVSVVAYTPGASLGAVLHVDPPLLRDVFEHSLHQAGIDVVDTSSDSMALLV